MGNREWVWGAKWVLEWEWEGKRMGTWLVGRIGDGNGIRMILISRKADTINRLQNRSRG